VSIRLFIWHAENVYALNMLLLLRRLKYDLFMNQSFRRYAAYAFGELLLVVVGILIALQIDNWNDDRKERATLQSYLHSIARNMREDLTELEPLRQHRRAARQAGLFFTYLLNKDNYTIDEIFFLNQVRVLSTREVFFNANTSSFEALKISGVLDRLQGSNIEHLLSSYYDTVNQISQLESSLYDLVRPISIELGRERVDHLEPFAIANPMALPPSRFQELQPTFSRIINSPMMGSLAASQAGNHLLLLHYDSLQILGESFIETVEAGQMDTSELLPRTPISNWNENLGLPRIVTEGRPELGAYSMWGATPSEGPYIFRVNSIRTIGGELLVDYPGGAEWASVYWVPQSVATSGRQHMDFSAFTKLHLELKGETGDETVDVLVKDADYPDHLEPISVQLQLSDEWQTYEIDLNEFAPNDLSRLHVVLGFSIYPADDALVFSIRNARYY
jgi:hypothetical protein